MGRDEGLSKRHTGKYIWRIVVQSPDWERSAPRPCRSRRRGVYRQEFAYYRRGSEESSLSARVKELGGRHPEYSFGVHRAFGG